MMPDLIIPGWLVTAVVWYIAVVVGLAIILAIPTYLFLKSQDML